MQQLHRFGQRQGPYIQALGRVGRIGSVVAGHQNPTAPGHSLYFPQVFSLLRSVQNKQHLPPGQNPQSRLSRGWLWFLAKTADNVFQGQGRVGLAIEGVENNAVGETVRRLTLVRGQTPHHLSRQGSLANPVRPAQGHHPTRLQIGQQPGQLVFAVGEVGGAGRALERNTRARSSINNIAIAHNSHVAPLDPAGLGFGQEFLGCGQYLRILVGFSRFNFFLYSGLACFGLGFLLQVFHRFHQAAVYPTFFL